MSRVVLLGAFVLVVAACSPSETTASTTTEATTTSTVATTTSSSTTTTTAPMTTTSAPSTTTTTLLEGNWADQPVVTSASANLTLGWWDGAQWIQAESGVDIPVSGGEDYQVALLGAEPAVITGGPQILGCDFLDFDLPGISLSDPDLLWREIPGDKSLRGTMQGVAISAPWDITPREATEGKTNLDIDAVAVQILSDRGFETAAAEIVQVVDADLDGDGSVESFVVAEETELANEATGVYSVVFAVGPAFSEPIVLAEDVVPEGETGYPISYRVGAVADLSGDGVMELVVDESAWEYGGVSVYEYADSRFQNPIGAGCGV